ncbi:hypothetical protein GPECTOR_115g339 [Gonium pectorale]|uniref:Guanylate cyclase domain-containing protein n=1 Tax=Gonium pectorale TaxID=33097 RepID=A0A150G059_GONPE|nr:hypothetical protein GPECTOR_115g339 [Gonium pectorale]|eukprot:KXZ42845.1 hypothetical protein GPECTOR_115g339 [Gonium pectorale]
MPQLTRIPVSIPATAGPFAEVAKLAKAKPRLPALLSSPGAASRTEQEVALYVAVPEALLCRLAHASSPLLRTLRTTQLGSLEAPTGNVTVAFMKVVGASTLLSELPGPASRALEQFQRLACGLLGGARGYLVEGGDGLLLAAFGSPLAGVHWALECVARLREERWEDELLGHELCEEVSLDVGAVSYSLVEASGRLSYRGRVMNRAARIAGTAAPGQVLCSGTAWVLASGEDVLPPAASEWGSSDVPSRTSGTAVAATTAASAAAVSSGAGSGNAGPAAAPALGALGRRAGGLVGTSLGRIALKGISAPVEVVHVTLAGA